jgi:7-carboxy-7-deazaguanine synthase
LTRSSEINSIKKGTRLPIVEEFYSVQGEGYHTGKAAYFIRIGGCDVGCSWCDTRFSWDASQHEMSDTLSIAGRVMASGADSVVVTGGEPLSCDLSLLCSELKKMGVKTYLETSGTFALSGQWDWICLSPKRNVPPLKELFNMAHELKIIIHEFSDFEWAEECSLKCNMNAFLFLQPEWSRYEEMIQTVVDYVKKNSRWMVSLQAHKFMKIP